MVPRLWKNGQFPVDKLVKSFDFADTNTASEESESGAVVKSLLVFSRDTSGRPSQHGTRRARVKAAWYDRQGPAREVLEVGDLPDPEPAAGEVRVRVRLSGVNPGDTKKRTGWLGSQMPYPRVVPHSDGAGVIDDVGDGVDPSRVGERVWVWGAQSYRAMGTAAQLTCVPADRAVGLPEGVSDEVGACLGIPGITAHRAVFGDGPVDGATVLVHGVRGGVGSLAAQLARWGGATVIGTVRRIGDVDRANQLGVAHVVPLDAADATGRIRDLAPTGVDRVIEVSLSDNVELDAAVLRVGGVIAAYASRDGQPSFPFWPMLFDNLTIRLLGSDDFPADAKRQAAADLTVAAADDALSIAFAEPLALDEIAAAHEAVDAGGAGRVLLRIE
jgi:NADPH2:quinone reductase